MTLFHCTFKTNIIHSQSSHTMDFVAHCKQLSKFEGVTGMLLTNNYQFVGYFEGSHNGVNKVSKQFRKEPFTDFKYISLGPVRKRLFEKWRYAFVVQNEHDEMDLKMINEDMKFHVKEELDGKSHFGVEILKSFYNNNEFSFYNFWREKATEVKYFTDYHSNDSLLTKVLE